MGHAGAVAAVQLKKAYIVGLPLEVLCSRGRRSTFAADPTDKEEKAAAETGIYASRAAHTLAPSASARDAASSPARRKRTIRTASRDIPH